MPRGIAKHERNKINKQEIEIQPFQPWTFATIYTYQFSNSLVCQQMDDRIECSFNDNNNTDHTEAFREFQEKFRCDHHFQLIFQLTTT